MVLALSARGRIAGKQGLHKLRGLHIVSCNTETYPCVVTVKDSNIPSKEAGTQAKALAVVSAESRHEGKAASAIPFINVIRGKEQQCAAIMSFQPDLWHAIHAAAVRSTLQFLLHPILQVIISCQKRGATVNSNLQLSKVLGDAIHGQVANGKLPVAVCQGRHTPPRHLPTCQSLFACTSKVQLAVTIVRQVQSKGGIFDLVRCSQLLEKRELRTANRRIVRGSPEPKDPIER
mmetsp:Transcript_124743/g.249104  ORF Transcript_124743/g.249104 Transcript_124743/m.249104 type:complete len:233 (-) Transcript_124743:386-1084(-)